MTPEEQAAKILPCEVADRGPGECYCNTCMRLRPAVAAALRETANDAYDSFASVDMQEKIALQAERDQLKQRADVQDREIRQLKAERDGRNLAHETLDGLNRKLNATNAALREQTAQRLHFEQRVAELGDKLKCLDTGPSDNCTCQVCCLIRAAMHKRRDVQAARAEGMRFALNNCEGLSPHDVDMLNAEIAAMERGKGGND